VVLPAVLVPVAFELKIRINAYNGLEGKAQGLCATETGGTTRLEVETREFLITIAMWADRVMNIGVFSLWNGGFHIELTNTPAALNSKGRVVIVHCLSPGTAR
jgi:hypothetical protein